MKHTLEFETKASLRKRLSESQTYAHRSRYLYEEQVQRNSLLAMDVKKLTDKVVSDAFLTQELKHQIAQQHIQLCNIRENYAGQQLAKLAPA
jgi:hypothetical protein